jgi:hypothetical protein
MTLVSSLGPENAAAVLGLCSLRMQVVSCRKALWAGNLSVHTKAGEASLNSQQVFGAWVPMSKAIC